MARPKKQDQEKRTETARFRTTLAEREYIRDQARLAGVSEADYLRARALGYRVAPAPKSAAVDPALVSELTRIGVNVNQLAKHANAGRAMPHSWTALSEQLHTILSRVAARYGP